MQHLGDTRQALGDRDAASESWSSALDILTQIGHPAAAPLRDKLDASRG